MGVVGILRRRPIVWIVFMLLVVACQGRSDVRGSIAKTLEGSDWSLVSPDYGDWGGTALAIYPAILVLIAAVVIPIALLAIVLFAIPLITPDGEGRSLFGQHVNPTLWSVHEAAEKILASECMERITCEASKLTTRYSRSLGNRIQRDLENSTWLSSRARTRLGRAIDVSSANECSKFHCGPPPHRTRRSITEVMSDWLDTDMLDPAEIWNKFVYYYGGRFLWVRKLQANKGVQFYPYLGKG